jgi:hypothetical protein
MKSLFAIVPARTNVEKTSAGIDTSAAPLSIVNSRVILSFTTTGTTNVPPSCLRATDSALAVALHASSSASRTICFIAAPKTRLGAFTSCRRVFPARVRLQIVHNRRNDAQIISISVSSEGCLSLRLVCECNFSATCDLFADRGTARAGPSRTGVTGALGPRIAGTAGPRITLAMANVVCGCRPGSRWRASAVA